MLCIRIANGTHIYGIGIGGINNYAVNAYRIIEAHFFPTATTVKGAIQTGTEVERIARIALSSAHPYYLWVALLNSDGSDILEGLVIEDRRPGVAGILGFPNASRSGSDINDIGVRDYCVHGGNTTAHAGWSNVAWFPILELSSVEGLGPGNACP